MLRLAGGCSRLFPARGPQRDRNGGSCGPFGCTDQILGCAEHGARNVRVFGSTARGETGARSDVDLRVEMEPGRSLLDLVGLWQDLEDLLGAHVDVLSKGGVSPFLREHVYADAIIL